MKILIIGGTGFLGPHLIDAALARGHGVTIVNRGKRAVSVDPRVEKLVADRTGDLSVLQGRTWDAVIDTSGYFPGIVRRSAKVLRDSVTTYLFVSSISVYADFSKPGLDEESAVGRLANPQEAETSGQITGENYGPLKAMCEEAVEAELPGRTLVIRPGLIVGPGDPTDRFSYWPARVDRGGDVLAPLPEDAAVQVIDARDLAQWMIRLIEQGNKGVYNATGPAERLTMGNLLRDCQAVSANDSKLVWATPDFLLGKGVQPFMELPLWIPGDDHLGFADVSIEKAKSAGLTFRDVKDTIRDTLAWLRMRPADHAWKAGMTAEREAEVLTAWAETK